MWFSFRRISQLDKLSSIQVFVGELVHCDILWAILYYVSILLLVINNTEPLPPLFSDVCGTEIQEKPLDPSSIANTKGL